MSELPEVTPDFVVPEGDRQRSVDAELVMLDAQPAGEQIDAQEPEELLLRSQIARRAGLPLGVVVHRLKSIFADSPELFTIDPETSAQKCSSRVIDILLGETPTSNTDDNGGAHSARSNNNGSGDGAERSTPEKTAKQLAKEFASFTAEMKAGESLDAQTFSNLISIFGKESSFDVLFRFRKDFNGKIPMEHVKSFLADYLGEFMLPQGEFNFDKLGESVPYLDDQKLQQSLVEVIKRDCLRSFNTLKRQNPDADDFALLAQYIGDIRDRVRGLDSEEVSKVMDSVEEYYMSVFLLEMPENLVESLTKGRPFPDLNQRINIYETVIKHRMLIADEPGMGKSASAIFTKELAGSELAVIITPSVVLKRGVWQEYLSAQQDENGKRIGYFKPGMEPRVLVVNSEDALRDVRKSDYDYILISQERLNEFHAITLKNLGFDMLIADEAHYFKNIIDGKKSEILIDLASTLDSVDDYLMLLTATPAPNKVSDIALMLRLLYPNMFKDHNNAQLIHEVLNGDLINLRNLLLPRMQMKSLGDTDEVEPYAERTIDVTLQPRHKDAYEVIIEDWQLEPQEKLRLLVKMLLNPALLDGTPGIESSKALAVAEHLAETFKDDKKVVMFVNMLVTGIITGENSILPDLGVPEDEVRIIHGKVKDGQRQASMDDFQKTAARMLLIISGQTASTGIDLSAADELIHLNEVWTTTELMQQIGRGQRPGRNGQLKNTSFMVPGTIEEGIKRYRVAKYQAIEKLLFGVPLTEIEKKVVEASELSEEQAFEVYPELAGYYISSIDRMNRFFGSVKEIGESGMMSFLETHGREYAQTYRDLTSRSYQANMSRMNGTLIDRLEKDADKPRTPKHILDIGSGPEMLRRHIAEHLVDNVTSIDINAEHLKDGTGKRVAGTMAHLPMKAGSVDYASMSLVFHYTGWAPKKKQFERLESLLELNRVLKPGGTAIISMPYSLTIRSDSSFRAALDKLGFQVVDNYSGKVTEDKHFEADVYTFTKVRDADTTVSELMKVHGPIITEALRLIKRETRLQDSRRIATSYVINGDMLIPAQMNSQDSAVLEEERAILTTMAGLRMATESKRNHDIPPEEIIKNGFARIFNGKSHVLFARLQKGMGAVLYHDS